MFKEIIKEIEDLDIKTKTKILEYYKKAILIPLKIVEIDYNTFKKYYDINTGCRVAIVK